MTDLVPDRLRKRDGTVVPFEPRRVRDAVAAAARETRDDDPDLADELTQAVVTELARRRTDSVPDVETVQDAVEHLLMRRGLTDVARAYVRYRDEHARLREAKARLGVRDDLKLGLHAVEILAGRYLHHDASGRIVESTGEMMERVAVHIAAAEDDFDPGTSARWAEAFAGMLRHLDFLPNSPTLMNAGTALGMLSGCFVLPVEDSLASIFTALRDAALVHQAGGGTGFSFSRVRPAGDLVASTGGAASGPTPFIEVFDAATAAVKQGGRRRGANMAVLDVCHPDIRQFVTAKRDPSRLNNFNLSVAVSDRFMEAARRGGEHALVNPRTGAVTSCVDAADLLDLIVEEAWRSGEPGLLFLDEINRANPLPDLGRIDATNPCGEVPLLPNESCTLGSLNLARFVENGEVDWERLGATTRLAVRFLDDVVEVNHYPTPETEAAARRTRKVGLGVMGLAEMLARLDMPYDSDHAPRLAGRVTAHIQHEAHAASEQLAGPRGAFPAFGQSRFAAQGAALLRNAQLTAVAPTGTISAIAGTTSGIEPLFAVAFMRHVLGRSMPETNPVFERRARDEGFWSDALIEEVARTGRVRGQPGVPAAAQRAFVSAMEISPERHLGMQAAVQRHVDAAVSKTVNLPPDASADEVRSLFFAAWQHRTKGITVYRYGSRAGQVLTLPSDDEPAVHAAREYTGGCAAHTCEY